MKKLFFGVAVAVLALSSCKKSTPTASLKTDVDTISY